jgi:hypothetical protein
MSERAMKQLAEMRHLLANWDSYGAKMIDGAVIAKAQELLPTLLPGDWWAVPGSDGSVQLELHANGFDIEIHVSNATQNA